MINNPPEPCSEDQFIKARTTKDLFGWVRAGNGESFTTAMGQFSSVLGVYARTGNRHWFFISTEPMNHASIMGRVYEVMAQERADMLEIV